MHRFIYLTLLAFISLTSGAGTSRAQAALVPALLRASSPVIAPHVYQGTYLAGRDTLVLRADGTGLGVVAHGTDAVVRWSHLAERDTALGTQAARILEWWVRGSLDATVDALPATLRSSGRAYVAGFLRALTARFGMPVGYRLVGTHRRADGRAESLAELAFAREQGLLVRLIWHAGPDPRLVTVARGASPVSLGRAYSADRDVFHLGTTQLRFNRGDDDGITGVQVLDGDEAQLFQRLAASEERPVLATAKRPQGRRTR